MIYTNQGDNKIHASSRNNKSKRQLTEHSKLSDICIRNSLQKRFSNPENFVDPPVRMMFLQTKACSI